MRYRHSVELLLSSVCEDNLVLHWRAGSPSFFWMRIHRSYSVIAGPEYAAPQTRRPSPSVDNTIVSFVCQHAQPKDRSVLHTIIVCFALCCFLFFRPVHRAPVVAAISPRVEAELLGDAFPCWSLGTRWKVCPGEVHQVEPLDAVMSHHLDAESVGHQSPCLYPHFGLRD